MRGLPRMGGCRESLMRGKPRIYAERGDLKRKSPVGEDRAPGARGRESTRL